MKTFYLFLFLVSGIVLAQPQVTDPANLLAYDQQFFHKEVEVKAKLGLNKVRGDGIYFAVYQPDNFMDGITGVVRKGSPIYGEFVNSKHEINDIVKLRGKFLPWSDGSSGGLVVVDSFEVDSGFGSSSGIPSWVWWIVGGIIGLAASSKKQTEMKNESQVTDQKDSDEKKSA